MSTSNYRRTIWGLTIAAGILSLGLTVRDPSEARAEGTSSAPGLVLTGCETWTPDLHATPVTQQVAGNEVRITGNGTPTCCGGWQFCYTGVREGQAYRLHTRVHHQGLQNARDSLVAIVLWDHWDRGVAESNSRPWNYLLPKPVSPDTLDFEAVGVAPPGATAMTIRYTLRWTEHGSSTWSAPQIQETTLPQRKPVKVCVLSETPQTRQRVKIRAFSQGLDLPRDVASAVDRWASLVEVACQRKPQLIVTPEIAISGRPLAEGSVTVPGPATRPFEKLAREHHVHLVLGVKERAGDAFYNSAVLLGPDGKILGVYRKVHLATSEGLNGTSPGNAFPVFDTGIGRIGCLICMDTTVSESARMLALQGADFICFPIMGDLRADRWSPGSPVFSEDRWKAIMRTRAIDNQVCMVVARNSVQGSCIIDRKGDILAWNEGEQEIIEATLPPSDGYRTWDGGDFREVTFLLRRPHLYGAYTDEANMKPLDRSEPIAAPGQPVTQASPPPGERPQAPPGPSASRQRPALPPFVPGELGRMGPRRAGQQTALEALSVPKDEAEARILKAIQEIPGKQGWRLNVPTTDGRVLRLLAESIDAKNVVEIGTSNGISAIWFGLALRKTGGRLITHEIDPAAAALARKNFALAGVSELVTVVEGDAHKTVSGLKGPIDLAFIDAEKEGYLDYFRKLLPLVRPGGLILAHNVPGMVDPAFVKAITTNPDLETRFYLQGEGLSVTLKKR